MTTPNDSPARRIIQCFGGITRCARALAKPKSTVQRWQDSGFVHPNYYPEILSAAVDEGIRLDARDFNLVDANHPAFSAPSTPSPDSTAAHGDAASPDPIPETVSSPPPDHVTSDRAVASAGG